MPERRILVAAYPWLDRTTTVDEYLNPNYYDRILKEYVFEHRTDLEIFRDWCSNITDSVRALELGSGTGRATGVFAETCQYHRLTLVDLSKQMLESAENRFAKDSRVDFIHSDALSFLDVTDETFDVIYTLWSFSHATHQWLSRLGFAKGRAEIRRIMKKMVDDNMRKGSKFFLMHFDSRSDEQRILIKQWRKVFPIFTNTHIQSPSQRIIDELLSEMGRKKIIHLTSQHLSGHPIVYKTLDEALEIFMNFHMESFFNTTPLAENVLKELTSYFQKFTFSDGTIRITPGVFIYTFEKIV
jgi:ubiquinone/menaquinone biosynthesis C-methylase UbiE